MGKNILEVLITAKDEASGNLGGLTGVLTGVGKGAMVAGAAVLGAGVAIGTGAFNMAAAAAPIQQTKNTFENLAASIGENSEQMLGKLRDATRGMISDGDLYQASNKLVAMGLASTADEAAKLTEMATQLGSAMGVGPTQAAEDFALMLANQSIPRLDSFGISSGAVRSRIEELMTADENLTREQAFMNAVMEQGAVTMEKVGEQSGTASSSMATMKAQMDNLQNSIGTALLPMLTSLAETLLPVIENLNPGLSEAAAVLGGIFATDIIPVLGGLIEAILPPIVELLPSITGLFSLLAGTLIGALVPVIEVLVGVLVMIIDMLSPLLEALLPPLVSIIDVVLSLIVALLPIVTSLLGILIPIIETILPPLIMLITGIIEVVVKLVTWLVDKLQPAFDAIAAVVKIVMDWFGKLTEKLGAIELPKWLTPGSPTPFETGLRGIADAMKDVDANIGGLDLNQTINSSSGPLSGISPRGGVQVVLNNNSVVSLADMNDAERKLAPMINRLVRKAMTQ